MKNYVQKGDNLTFLDSQIVHGVGSANPRTTSGDACVVSKVVGVAHTTAALATDNVVISTYGVYSLSVIGNNGVAAAIAVGDRVYIDGATGVVNSNSAKVPFGFALDPVLSGATTTIRVQLCPQ